MSVGKKDNINVSATPKPTTSSLSKDTVEETSTLVFGKKNYQIILIGAALILVGLFLMSGGKMPSRDVWDETLIYSARRITIAPMFILAGLGIQIYAIFAKKN